MEADREQYRRGESRPVHNLILVNQSKSAYMAARRIGRIRRSRADNLETRTSQNTASLGRFGQRTAPKARPGTPS
jgi:hypothetical protein